MKVYLIGNVDFGFYKIGITRQAVKWRLLDIDSPRLPFSLEVLAEYDAGLAAHFIEVELHKLYKKTNARGEWFNNISTEDFLRQAKKLHAAYTPKPKRVYVDPYAGTVWGTLSSSARVAVIMSLERKTLEDAKALMDGLMAKTETSNARVGTLN
jgi:hypothetical protein